VGAETDFYLHIRVIIGLVTGLAITRCLAGFAGIIQHPARRKNYLVHLLWAASVLLMAIHFWWWEFNLVRISWTFELYLFVIGYAGLFYLMATLLFPDQMDDYDGFKDFFLSRRRWFFAILAVSYLADVADTLIKGHDYAARFGFEYPVRIGVYLLLCGVAMSTRNGRFHLAFAVANLAYQVSWIVRLYNREI
jgi:hypothetical protein